MPPIVSVDAKTLEIAEYLIQKNGLTEYVRLFEERSEVLAGKWTKLVDNPSISLLYIDGDHSYQGASNDIILWSPYLKKGGMIVLHDYNSLGCPEVNKAVYDHIIQNPSYGEFQEIDGLIQSFFVAKKIK
jgi:predicted O-methyltransferase YrrM